MASEEKNRRLLELFEPHAQFASVFFDGYVLLNADAKILKANKYFSRLTGVPANLLLLADSLADIIRLEVGGEIVQLETIINQTKPARIDELKGITGKMEDHFLTVSVYPFWEDNCLLGAFLMIRDVSADNELQSRYKVKSVLSVTDALTGLYNRAHFQQYLPAQFTKYRNIPGHRDDRKMSLIMLDIDHFKRTNDTFGHLAGDYVIRELAQTLKKNSRTSDIICRYGGEEFLAILPETNLAGACVVAEKFRMAVEAKSFIFEGKKIPTTISLGISSIDFSADKVEQAMERADAALYESKRTGRNRATAHDGKVTSTVTVGTALKNIS
jgi:diguanylate cyclase (GGDEF)-like protein